MAEGKLFAVVGLARKWLDDRQQHGAQLATTAAIDEAARQYVVKKRRDKRGLEFSIARVRKPSYD